MAWSGKPCVGARAVCRLLYALVIRRVQCNVVLFAIKRVRVYRQVKYNIFYDNIIICTLHRVHLRSVYACNVYAYDNVCARAHYRRRRQRLRSRSSLVLR